MRDLVAAVRFEHRKVLRLADDLMAACQDGATGARRARKAAAALVRLESRHEAAEAMYLWPVVRDRLPQYAELREVARIQERQGRRDLHRLHKLSGAAPFEEHAVATVRALLAHIGLEESQILPSLAATLDADDSFRIGRMYEQASSSGPTRPHPLMPAVPGVLALAAPVAARVDRIRDLLRIR